MYLDIELDHQTLISSLINKEFLHLERLPCFNEISPPDNIESELIKVIVMLFMGKEHFVLMRDVYHHRVMSKMYLLLLFYIFIERLGIKVSFNDPQ